MLTTENSKTMTINRRTILKGAGAAAAISACPIGMPAIAQTLRKVTIVYGVQTIQSAAEGYFSSIPIGLGFYRDEGLDVEIQTIGGSSAAVNLLASGQAEFSTHGCAGLFTGVGQGVDMKGFICQIPDYFVALAVPKDSDIQSVEDLKGKTIGVNANGGSPHLVMQAVLKNMGWDPQSDVEFLAVGSALPALNALQTGQCQAIALWDTVFASFEFRGQEFRYFRPEPIPSIGFTHATNAMTSTIENDPEIVAGMTRAMCKAIVYMAAAEPEELTKLHLKVFPASNSAGMSEEDLLRLDVLRQTARHANMRLDKRVFSQEERLGDITDEMIAGHRDLLANGGIIPEALPVDRYFTRQFLEYGNDIDIPALIEQAKAFRA